METKLGRSTGRGSDSSGSESGSAKIKASSEEKTTFDDSSGLGGSGGELVRSFVELVKSVEAKVSAAGMSFGEVDMCVGSVSVGDFETNSDVNVNVNGNCRGGDKGSSGVEENENSRDVANGVKENGSLCDVNNGVEENGKALDGDGETLVVDHFSISDESEDSEEGEGEESSDGEYEFCVGDFVWGKIKHHPWWPGQICDPSDASEHAVKLKSKGKLLVAYYGDDIFSWCHPSQLKPFEENFVEFSKLSSSGVFVLAVKQALDEICRLVKLNMSCACMGEEFLSSCNRPLASNAGVKEGVFVPAGRVGDLFVHLSQPSGLLTELKDIAQVASSTNALELNVLKTLLSAFFLREGGHQLPSYNEPQLIPGLEDDRKMVEVPVKWSSDDRSSVSVGFNTGNDKQILVQKSPRSIENRQPHKRKEKSIADILEEVKAVDAKDMDVVVGKEGEISEKQVAFSRKKRKSDGREEESKKAPVSRRRKSNECIGTDGKNGDALGKSGGTDGTNKAPSSKRRKKNEDVHINSSDGEANAGELGNIHMKDQIEKASLSRERKISKYLSPPFLLIDDTRRRKPENLQTETPNAGAIHDLGAEEKGRDMELVVSLVGSDNSQFEQRMTRAATILKDPPQVLDRWSEEPQQKQLIDGENNRNDARTPAAGERKNVDPMIAKTPSNEVLSGVLSAAVDPLYPIKQKSSHKSVTDFISIFRDSVFRNGCNSELSTKHQGFGKRKKSEPELSVEDDQTAGNEGESGVRDRKKNQTLVSGQHTKKKAGETRSAKRRMLNSVIKSLSNDEEKAENLPFSGSRQRDDSSKPDKPKMKQTTERPISELKRRRSKHAEGRSLKDTETEEESSRTILFVTFGPGSSLPTKDDLLRIYGEFGKLNENETDMFYTNFSARVVFVSSSDAEEAFNHSLIHSPFGTSNVKFRLQNPSGASKTRELSELPKSTPAKRSRAKTASKASGSSKTRELSALPNSPPAKRSKTKTASKAPVAPETVAVEQPSEVGFIRNKLEMMESMLGSSDRKMSPVVQSKLKKEINDLLKVVSTMGKSNS